MAELEFKHKVEDENLKKEFERVLNEDLNELRKELEKTYKVS